MSYHRPYELVVLWGDLVMGRAGPIRFIRTATRRDRRQLIEQGEMR
jgi:hypothetical protein